MVYKDAANTNFVRLILLSAGGRIAFVKVLDHVIMKSAVNFLTLTVMDHDFAVPICLCHTRRLKFLRFTHSRFFPQDQYS